MIRRHPPARGDGGPNRWHEIAQRRNHPTNLRHRTAAGASPRRDLQKPGHERPVRIRTAAWQRRVRHDPVRPSGAVTPSGAVSSQNASIKISKIRRETSLDTGRRKRPEQSPEVLGAGGGDGSRRRVPDPPGGLVRGMDDKGESMQQKGAKKESRDCMEGSEENKTDFNGFRLNRSSTSSSPPPSPTHPSSSLPHRRCPAQSSRSHTTRRAPPPSSSARPSATLPCC